MTEDFYKYGGFWWKSVSFDDRHEIDSIRGPFCIDCYGDLNTLSWGEIHDLNWKGKLVCLNCNKQHVMKTSYGGMCHAIAQILNSNYRATLNKIALDEPITQVKVKDEDDSYFLSAKIGQKDGKKVGVVYFGEKNKDQKKKDYAQIFIDLDDEQYRFDKSNKNPKDIVAKFYVEFPETKQKFEKKNK